MDAERITRKLEGLDPRQRERARVLVDEVVECDREIARAEGKKALVLAELAEIAHAEGERSPAPNGIEDARRAMASEIAAATHTHPAAAKHVMEEAEGFVSDYPRMREALCDGRISARHARAVADAGGVLDHDARASLDDAAVPFAETSTPGDLKRIVKQQVAQLDAVSLHERHERERAKRFVTLTERDDGMSDLLFYMPTFEARAIYDRATQLAKVVKTDRRRARREAQGARGIGEVSAASESAARDRGDDVRTRSVRADSNSGARDYADAGGAKVDRADNERSIRAHTDAARATADHANGENADPDRDEAGGARSGRADGDDAREAVAQTSGRAQSADAASGPSLLNADSAVTATDLRTTDQLRVDILTDLILTSSPTAHELHASGSGSALAEVSATVQVTVPVEQIIDPSDGISWIDEGGLISPNTARGIAGRAAGWERLFYRPETGVIEHVDHYRPSSGQRRALIGRDVTCRFPGCTTPARRSDVDHTRDYARGGSTTLTNLAHLCESHHVMKHQSGWSVTQRAHGVMEWTSPTGRTYEDEPVSRVFFRQTAGSDDEDDPPWATRRAT
ncbi:hypothetical protein GCM10010915_18480 [Microbacterium faecale]|uniref:HNH nuclease domain-containing protein n=1 Tax=Microbacterium faecale TaxID=1804630 RepID=A0A916YAL4_9MICO|nr:HNH endonuclease signature motif containing protein [Microbacterium faecale]GGD37970.1 hypothetical protein GCM10010915_18480 [Microbacterium faecale]